MKAAIPKHQPNKVTANLTETAIAKREKALYDSALAVETDAALTNETADWDVTVADGLDELPCP